MKQRAEDNRRKLSLIYNDALDEANVKQDSEGFALGMSQSYVAKCTNPDSDTNLSAADLIDSRVGDIVFNRIAELKGLTVVPGNYKLNGTTKDEKAAVLRSLAKMAEGCDEITEVKQWKAIAQQATAALKELA